MNNTSLRILHSSNVFSVFEITLDTVFSRANKHLFSGYYLFQLRVCLIHGSIGYPIIILI